MRGYTLLSLIAALVGTLGCSAIGYHRIAGPPAAEEVPRDASRVVLVVVDGLRADVLADYVRTLRENDFEPTWPSGLSRLAREGLRLAPALRAEAPLPGFGLAADAVLLTGQHPEATGIPGSVFYESAPDGSLRRFDFTDTTDAARIYYPLNFDLPDADRRPLLETLLRAPTLYERLPPGQAVSVLHVFGRGAEWLVPERSGDGINAILQHEISSWAVPLFDRGVRNAAIDVVLRRAPPRLITLSFRGVSAGSCFQAERACQVEPPSLTDIQVDRLREVDDHLERILRVLAARPEGLARTSVILTGTAGLVERTQDGTTELNAEQVFERLASQAEPACAQWLREAPARGDLVLAPNGQMAHVYIRRWPAGQGSDRARGLDCLGGALRASLAPKGVEWLAGAAWMPGAADGAPTPRGARIEVALSEALTGDLAASRRGRIQARLRRAFDDGEVTRAGDALLFAEAPWIFTDQLLRRPSAHASTGGLEEGAVGTAFLLADARLDDVVVQGLTTTVVELADVAPTVLTLLQAPPAAFAGLPRPPLLAWQGDRLTFAGADRQVQAPPPAGDARLIWQESPEKVTFGLEEPSSLWPPDTVGLRFGDQIFPWNPEGDPFAPGAPCQFSEGEGRRRFVCAVPVDRTTPALTVAGVRRTPAGQPGDSPPPATDFLVPVVLGPAAPPAVERLAVKCATPTHLRVDLAARDALGLSHLEVVVADRSGSGRRDRIPGGLAVRVPLGGLAPAAACRANPLDPACTVAPVRDAWTGDVELAFPVAWLDHERRSRRLLSVKEGDLDDLVRRFGATPAQEPPLAAWLLARVCNVAGRCEDRPLLSDRDHRALAEAGCGEATAEGQAAGP